MADFSLQFDNKPLYIGGPIVDDEWVHKIVGMSPNALGNRQIYKYDLISTGYLPDDNYDYEILISTAIWTTAVAGAICGLWIYSVDRSYNVNDFTTVDSITPYMFRTRSVRQRARVAYHARETNNIIFPIINGGKKLVFWNPDTTDGQMYSWNFRLEGYRRLGTNE